MTKRTRHTMLWLACLLTIGGTPLNHRAQQPDSVRRPTLEEVRVTEQKVPSTFRQETPIQVVSAKQIEQSGAVQLSDAMRSMAGVTLKDYGGIGGMKTISVRGLGSQFTMLTIDGIAVSDCQNGQIDLGRYLLGNSAYVAFANGHTASLLQSASAIGAGNIVAMETAMPQLVGKNTNIKASVEGGSYGLFAPSLTIEQRLSRKIAISLWGNMIRSDGDYPYKSYQASADGDHKITARRQNSQMWMVTSDANIFYTPSHNQHITAKIHYMQARHNLPGAVLLYNTQAASDHTEDMLVFGQARYVGAWLSDSNGHERLRLQIMGKYQMTNTIYEDTFHYHPIHNDYRQQEGYLSSTLLYEPLPRLRISVAEDLITNGLQSNLAINDRVRRFSSLTALSAGYEGSLFSASARLVATIIDEKATTSASSNTINHPMRHLSPMASISLVPLKCFDGLRLRYFYKQCYRVPTFNEMYFLTTSHLLRPELARQHGVGVTCLVVNDSSTLRRLHLAADGYINRVADKIVAIPISNMFVWSMINIGEVAIRGIDITAEAAVAIGATTTLNISANYSYQHATDQTDPDSKSYGHQIPYTPRHSAAGCLMLQNPIVDVGYDITFVGTRYSMKQNTPECRLAPYADHGISLARSFPLKHGNIRIQARILNLFDTRYEIVRSYPMMGRNYRLSLTYKW